MPARSLPLHALRHQAQAVPAGAPQHRAQARVTQQAQRAQEAQEAQEDEACRCAALNTHPERRHEEHPLLSLPSCRLPVTPLHPDRRHHFESILSARIHEAAAAPAPAAACTSWELPPLPHSEILGRACALCRGACCTAAADHANLDVATLQRVRRLHPDWSENDTRQAYLACLPQHSTEGSCIFHAQAGCTLPRELRASACNYLLCDGLRRLRHRIEARATPQSATAVVRSHGYWPGHGDRPSRILEVHFLSGTGAERA